MYAIQTNDPITTKQMMDKVPRITLYFWVIKILCTTIGEKNGGLGLSTAITSAIFLVAIVATVIYLSVTKKDVIKDDK